jgi:hypothetical protein
LMASAIKMRLATAPPLWAARLLDACEGVHNASSK